ncbi:MAG: hypothetical protein JSU95_10230 [Betaproteobacteria bacterium]|nr:MAG: hypothetical protein JSU95_10230 [Betaproteobacteria bacterium]
MGWKQLEFKDRWSLLTSGLQALATLGTFIVALIGVWKVAPIITYQVQQQESEAVARQTQFAGEAVEHPFVKDALVWWTKQVENYGQIVELTHSAVHKGSKVSFEVRRRGGTAIAPGLKPDLLVVTAISSAGKKEVVSVPVNQDAMSPSQYVRFKVNQGAFADLPKAERRRLEVAVERYINRDMVPKVPPVIVRPDMSLTQLHEEVAMNQHHREEALRHIVGLDEVLASATRSN